MVRSISDASRPLIGLTSTPSDGHGLDDGELADPGGYCGIPKHRRARHAWCNLLEQFQPFRGQTVFELHEAGSVAAGLRQTIDDTGADWIEDDHEHDRHGARRL